MLEEYAFPGQIIIGTDSHTPNAGGLGACAVGVGGADAVEGMAGLPWELLYPKRIAVYLTGKLNGWTAPKDVILWVAGQLTVSGATNAIVEYIGPGARSISATGKATTDHISPAGPWLIYRGHLDRFSDNLLMGGVNAWTGARGTTADVLNPGVATSISQVARAYKARGLRWVIVGDANYGEGSSREHAALSPRLLGGAAVIARSFARIHESNLKKQGLLALTFSDPAHYDRIREGDRISAIGLSSIEPGRPVVCQVHHADGTVEPLELRHTYSKSQLEWFRAGSALNCISHARSA